VAQVRANSRWKPNFRRQGTGRSTVRSRRTGHGPAGTWYRFDSQSQLTLESTDRRRDGEDTRVGSRRRCCPRNQPRQRGSIFPPAPNIRTSLWSRCMKPQSAPLGRITRPRALKCPSLLFAHQANSGPRSQTATPARRASRATAAHPQERPLSGTDGSMQPIQSMQQRGIHCNPSRMRSKGVETNARARLSSRYHGQVVIENPVCRSITRK